ncbi:hypothetical protein D3C76_914950 [compost metagenome]
MLIDNWQDRTGNQVPFFIKRKWQHRLNIGDGLYAVIGGAELLVPVVLNRQTVQRSNRVQGLFGQFCLTISGKTNFGPDHRQSDKSN